MSILTRQRAWLELFMRLCAPTWLACGHDAPLGSACPVGERVCIEAPLDREAGLVPLDRAATGLPPLDRDAGLAQLSATIVNALGQPSTHEQLACGEACIDVTVSVQGGQAPYRYTWSDGDLAPQRQLCPGDDTVYSVLVNDDTPASPAAASIALDLGSCPSDAGEPEARDCQRFSVGQYLTCGNVGTKGATPQLRASVAYTLRAHGPARAGATLQVVGASSSCVPETLNTLSLSGIGSDTTGCIEPKQDCTAILLTGTAVDFINSTESYVEICRGCN